MNTVGNPALDLCRLPATNAQISRISRRTNAENQRAGGAASCASLDCSLPTAARPIPAMNAELAESSRGSRSIRDFKPPLNRTIISTGERCERLVFCRSGFSRDAFRQHDG
jgi:hypothetical protein